MKTNLRGDWWRIALPLIVFSLVGGISLIGCAGGEEFYEEEDEWEVGRTPQLPPTQAMIDSLENEISMLKQMNAKLEAERRSYNARIAELETNLAMEREREREVTPPTRARVSDAAGYYSQGLSMFRNRNYEAALDIFMELIAGGVSEDLQDNAHYWAGECLYAMRRYDDALQQFNPVFGYRVSEKKDDAQIMIANCYARMGDRGQARLEYQKLIDSYPTSEYVERARAALEKLR